MTRLRTGLLLFAAAFAMTASGASAASVQQWVTPGGPYVNKKDLKPRDLVGGKLVTNVVLPARYRSRRCWPVMYLLHGTADNTASSVSLQWLQIDHAQLLKMNIPAILVIPGSGDSWWTNNWWNGYRHPAWESWLLQDIVPLVGRRLHVCPGRNEHSIAGLSMGGYGAMLLASQRPDYFGSAGSFSGVLSPENFNFVNIYSPFTTLWGPPNHFYAVGHDPVALVDNLRHTRVFVGVGNGTPTAGETNALVSVFEEAEFNFEDVLFVNKARAHGVSVRFDQHAGTHDPLNWLQTLAHMLQWNPYTRVVAHPSSWTFSTVETSGTAWDYRYDFGHFTPPTQVEQFSLHNGVFSARGSGTVTITQPNGRRLRGRIPFDIQRGVLTPRRHVPKPSVTGGYQHLAKVTPRVTRAPATATAPVQISFTTAQALPANEEYQVLVSSPPAGGSSCQDLSAARLVRSGKGVRVTATVSPSSSATTPGAWCSGQAFVLLSEVPKGSPPVLGNLLGYTLVKLP